MPTTPETQVPEEEQVQVSTTPETQAAQAQVATEATPATPSTDADVQALKKQLEKYELDIRKMKSTYDRKLTESEKQWQQKADELRRQAEELKLNSMDEAGRAKYIADKERLRLQELESTASKANTIEADYKASLGAIKYFTSLGVPLSELVTDEGYDELFQSGFQYVTKDYQTLKTTPTTLTPPLPPIAPDVNTQSGSTPNLKPTWPDLIKTYGSMENVFKLVENQRLDPSIIPLDE